MPSSIKLKNTLRKRFIAAESDALVIETIQTESKTHRQRLRILKLKGTWRANDYNELIFEASGRKGTPDKYTFKGSWKLNSNQQIEYTTEDGRDTLVFRGFWQIFSAKRLIYKLEGSSTSRFEFKVQLEPINFYPKKGEICYRIGIGMRQSRLTRPGKLLILYGEWKFGRNLGLTFQMDYGQGRVKVMEFGATVSFLSNKVIFILRDEFGKPLGVSFTLTHKFLESYDAEAFIKLKSFQNNRAVEAGFNIPF